MEEYRLRTGETLVVRILEPPLGDYAGRIEYWWRGKQHRESSDSDKQSVAVKLLKKRAEAEKEVRKIETSYFKAVSPLIETFDDGEMHQLTESWQRRSECLFKRAAAALDDARKFNYTVSWEEFGQKKLLYDIHQESQGASTGRLAKL